MTADTPTADTPSFSPAEAAIAASGIDMTAREAAALVRLVARRLPAGRDAIAAALCEVRRKGWTNHLLDHANRQGWPWVGRADARAAAAGITDPAAGQPALLAALDQTLRDRLRDSAATPAATLDLVTADLPPLPAERHEELARLIARAHALTGDDASAFLESAALLDRQRRQEQGRARTDARARRREEVAKLRAWEDTLVPFRDLPAILRCSKAEAQKWAADGRIPIARKRGAQWEFDPFVIAGLRDQIPHWRDQGPGRPPAKAAPGAPALLTGRAANEAVARVAALDRYAAHFRTARALARRITLVTGPTNSGKSHLALDRLAAAESGLALAPLRLLAHEFRDALIARGVPASLSTGEERIAMPGSRHQAATVEMCPMHNPVSVAVVDEAQMLFDRDRGAAWTAAIMGAPATDVIVLGAPDCIASVRRIAALCADPVEEVALARKGVLRAATAPVGLGDLRAGDALVAFSRRDVLDLRAELLRRGRRVAVVYGALSPEVRRAEAARFNTGEADILVATDAIGMGLNLNIRRVVFAALSKFDGAERRALTAQEVKQIGGRAGRYGRHEEGIVAVLAGAGRPELVATLLQAAPVLPDDLRPLVQPDADIIRLVAAEIGSESLFGVLARIRRAVLRRDDPHYRLADMTAQFAIASAIEGVAGLALLERWTYALCPVDERDNGVTRLAGWATEHAAGRLVQPPLAGRLPPPERASREDLERAEKIQRRLVAWRWLALRFPLAYRDTQDAEAETLRLNDWVESVLRQQRRARTGGAHARPG